MNKHTLQKHILLFCLIIIFLFTLTCCNEDDNAGSSPSQSTSDSTQSAPSNQDAAPSKAPEEEHYDTITGLKPIEEKIHTVTDPENTRKLSTKRVAHWFGKDTPKQPKIFQEEYEKNSWSALTYDNKSTDKVLYLTFDCGYENGYTETILDTLKEKNAPAAFFITMDYVEEAPETTARMIKEGHIVGNHSTTHPDFSTISRTQMVEELQQLDNHLRKNFGYTSCYFRYPMGRYNESSMELLTSMGYRSIFWSYAYADYDEIVYGNDYAFDKVTSNLHPGEVLLLHAISADNAGALGDIIDYARGQGYEIRSLNEYKWN